MLTNLLATIMISIGMAIKTMPIYDYNEEAKKTNLCTQLKEPKKANDEIVQEYSLALTSQPYTTANTTLSTGSKTYYRTSKNTGNNSYLNVIGSYYQNECVLDGTRWHKITNSSQTLTNGVYNYNSLYSQNTEDTYETSKIMYVLKINGYNFNIDNVISYKFKFAIQDTTASGGYILNGQAYRFSKIYKNVRMYQSQDNTWDDFIDRQNNYTNITYIEQEILNINNGYYYQYDEQLLETNSNQDNGISTIEKEIYITPNANNYVVIVVEPMVEFDQTAYSNQTTYEDLNSKLITNAYNTTDNSWFIRPYSEQYVVITGTNIIPNGTYEVIDIPGMMFQILGMPFTFISTAFNLTLFPNTPYQINLSNLFLAIIGLFVFIFLIRLLIKAGMSMAG